MKISNWVKRSEGMREVTCIFDKGELVITHEGLKVTVTIAEDDEYCTISKHGITRHHVNLYHAARYISGYLDLPIYADGFLEQVIASTLC